MRKKGVNLGGLTPFSLSDFQTFRLSDFQTFRLSNLYFTKATFICEV